MQKRLVGIDIDGTLLRGSIEPQPDDKRAIERAVRQGVPVILATGRSHFSSQPLAAELCPGMPHVAYNGATIVAADGHFTRDFRVPLEAARYVLARCRDIGLAVRVFLPDAVVMSEIP